MLRAIKKTRIHEEVFSQIHELIKEGRFKGRDQLPSERELAEIFKVSRTSVREALRALESQGLIVSRTGMGNFIVDLPVAALVGPLAYLLIDEKKALADVFEMRKLIEPQIAALAAERATRKDVAQLKRILARQTEALGSGRTGVEADAEFHFTIGRATRNQALQKLISGLMELLSRSREDSLQTERTQESIRRRPSQDYRRDRKARQKPGAGRNAAPHRGGRTKCRRNTPRVWRQQEAVPSCR